MKLVTHYFPSILLCTFILTFSSQVNAAMYKYVKSDGSTILSGEKLKGSGFKLVKIYQIKKKGAYKSSLTNKPKTVNLSKTQKTKRKSNYKKRKNSRLNNNKGIKYANLVDPNGRDNGIIVGCGDDRHLNKQARVYKKPIQIYSRIYKVDEELIHAIVKQESCFNEGAHSRVGAIGLMQLMPQTALGLRINDPWNPEQNIHGGVKYIAKMLERFDGNYKLAIAAYNAGPGNVNKYNGIPPFNETRNYVKKVYAEYKRLKKEGIGYKRKIQLASK